MTLTDTLSAVQGSPPHSITPLSGGSVGEVYRVTYADGEEWVAKVNTGPQPNLDIEAYMLEYLQEHSDLPVPHVKYSSPELLVMEMKAGESSFSEASEKHAAELLSALHTIAAPQFGLKKDTLIGSLHQPNTLTDSWLNFFRDHRLLHMAQHAYQENRMDLAMLNRLEKFATDLDKWLDEPAQPSLLHGDVWTTNVLAKEGKISAFLDPAIYYGHPEIELAFITLFSTFGRSFFDAYGNSAGIAPGFFEERRDIYNLYPLLVHVRLFGGGYLSSVEQTIARFGY